MKEIGKILADYREKARLSQDELGAKVSLTQGYISDIENGSRPRVSFMVIMRIAAAINCPLSVLSKELTENDIRALETVRKLSESIKK